MNALSMVQLWRLARDLSRHDRWTPEQLQAYRDIALRRLREHAYARSPFYREFHRGLTDRPLQELPVLTKARLMERFDDVVTDRAVTLKQVEEHVRSLRGDGRFLGRYRVNATSGTTGARGLFLYSHREWLTTLSGFLRGYMWTGASLTRRAKVAAVASTAPWHLTSRVASSLTSPWTPTLRLDATEPLDVVVARLNEWQPAVLVVYPSVARLLADAQSARHLRISPRVVLTCAELLSGEIRQRIKEAWGTAPFDQYSASESGELAAECTAHSGWHLSDDLVITEVVDRDDRPVPAGTHGDKLLVTVLFNYTQPLIRYELSDSLRLSATRCPCGRPFPLVDGILGREEDVLYFPAAAGGRVAVHPNVFHRVADILPAQGWQVLQEPGGLTVLLTGVPEHFDTAALVEGLEKELMAQGAVVPPISVRRVESIPRGASGKAPLIKSAMTSRPS